MPPKPQGNAEPPADHPAVREAQRCGHELAELNNRAKEVRAERDRALAQLIREGYTPGKAAKAVGLSSQTVRNIKLEILRNNQEKRQN